MSFNRRKTVIYLVFFSFVVNILFPSAVKTYAETSFTDVEQNYWAHDAIQYLSSLGVIKGYQENDGTSNFKPDNHVTRAQAAIMFVKALYPNDTGKVVDQPTFPDVPLDHFASRFIERAFELGIFKGKQNGTFAPNDPITRAQMSAVIANVFPLDKNLVFTSGFNDVSTNHWAYETITLLTANGIITPEESYQPEAVTTRAHFSVFLTNALHVEKITEVPVAKGEVNATNLNVRELPSTTSKIISSLPNGQKVEIYGELNEWYVIKHNDRRAYIASGFINNLEILEVNEPVTESPSQDAEEELPSEAEGETGGTSDETSGETTDETADDTEDELNDTSQSDTESETENEQPSASPQQGEESDLSEVTSEVVISKGLVTATSLNVRDMPSISGNVVGSLANGKQVDIYAFEHGLDVLELEGEGDWAKIRFENEYHYIHKGFLSLTNLEGDKIRGKTIVIDPGHGGNDPGAIGFGLMEKEIVLDVSLRLRERLQAVGVNVIMTRDTDTTVTLDQRIIVANNSQADSFISIHANAFTDKNVNGTETYWNSGFTSLHSETLAQEVQSELLFLLSTYDRGVKHGNFRVIKHTQVPSILVELAFLSNQKDAEYMTTPQFRDQAAQALFQGIINYYNKQ